MTIKDNKAENLISLLHKIITIQSEVKQGLRHQSDVTIEMNKLHKMKELV